MWRNDYLENDISFVSLLCIFYYGSLQKKKNNSQKKKEPVFHEYSHKSKLQILKDIKQKWIIIWLVPFFHNYYLKWTINICFIRTGIF